MKTITLIAALVGSQTALGQVAKPDGWQFHNFFGTYDVVAPGGTCAQLSGKIFIGFKHTTDFPSIEIKPVFPSESTFFQYLRNSTSHGQDCYECDPDWHETVVVAGDGIKNAIFTINGIRPYNHHKYSETIEMVKSNRKVYIKWNDCSAELIKK